jgi:hypothetical protein
MARAVEIGRAARKIVVDGAPVPHSWFGKQWACWQGVQEARGEFLLFTAADTLHGGDWLYDSLLDRVGGALRRPRLGRTALSPRRAVGSLDLRAQLGGPRPS